MNTHPIERLKELLIYSQETGLFVWRVTRSGKTKAGMAAGTRNKLGYVNLRIDYREFGAHRVAWAITNGQWPTGDIDHINGDPSDNRIANLRDVPRAENLQNQRRAHRDSKSGILGVREVRPGRFQAKIMRNYRLYDLGDFPTAEEASAAYIKAKRELHAGCQI